LSKAANSINRPTVDFENRLLKIGDREVIQPLLLLYPDPQQVQGSANMAVHHNNVLANNHFRKVSNWNIRRGENRSIRRKRYEEGEEIERKGGM